MRNKAECHPDKYVVGNGLCQTCYDREKSKDPRVQERQRKSSRECMQRKRLDPEFRKRDNERRSKRHKEDRKDPIKLERMRESRRKAQKKYYKKNYGHRREWERRNKERRYFYKLKRKYGIAREEYLKMYIDQSGLCRICEKREPLMVDHNHETGKTRGLLCRVCNSGLGFFRDDANVLQKAITYLEETKKAVRGK